MSYYLITSTRLDTTATSVAFSNIPQIYKDLEVRISARQQQANSGSPIYPRINGDSTQTNYARVQWSFQSSPTSTQRGNDNYLSQLTDGAAITGAFSYLRLYIPNYSLTTITNKPFIFTNYYGNNTGNSFTYAEDGVMFRESTGAITSLTFPAYSTGNYVANSLFELYGILKS